MCASIEEGREGATEEDHFGEITNERCARGDTVETKKSKREETVMVMAMLRMTVDEAKDLKHEVVKPRKGLMPKPERRGRQIKLSDGRLRKCRKWSVRQGFASEDRKTHFLPVSLPPPQRRLPLQEKD
jgi:hypothetical protein